MTTDEFQTEVLRRLDALDERLSEVEDAAQCANINASGAQSEATSVMTELREVRESVDWLCGRLEDEDDDSEG
jgi:hypothetical protein